MYVLMGHYISYSRETEIPPAYIEQGKCQPHTHSKETGANTTPILMAGQMPPLYLEQRNRAIDTIILRAE